MKRKNLLLVAVVVGIAFIFAATGIYAGTKAPEMIKMDNKAYKAHKKGIVEFSHKKHVADYGAGCGECHHDKDGKPLDNLVEGKDDVQSCLDCHSKPSEKPKGKDAPKLSKKEKLEYHAEALHMNCKGCHKAFNKKTKSKKAPTTCTKCHPKKKK